MPPTKSDNDAERRARLDEHLARLRDERQREWSTAAVEKAQRQAKAATRARRPVLARSKR